MTTNAQKHKTKKNGEPDLRFSRNKKHPKACRNKRPTSPAQHGGVAHLVPLRSSRNLKKMRDIPKALTVDAWNRMHGELDYDPLAAAVHVAQGKGLTKDHPFLAMVFETVGGWRKKTEAGEMIDDSEFELFMKTAETMLTDSWVSHELRSKHIIDLLSYIYPKKKAVEMNHGGSVAVDMSLKPLTATEVKAFKTNFDKHY